MKKLLLAFLVIFICGGVQATDLSVIHYDTVNAADTNGLRTDTAITGALDISAFKRLWFSVEVKQMAGNNDYTLDTIVARFQHSVDKSTWLNYADTLHIDTMIDGDSIITVSFNLNRDSVQIGPWLRGWFNYNDRCANCQDSLANASTRKYTLWITGIK